MRRVNVKNGLKQRLNEILGTDEGAVNENGAYEITQWSIQAAMIENMQRICSALVGNAPGRPMKGLVLTTYSGLNCIVTGGIGFTPEGNIIVIEAGLVIPIPPNVTRHISVKHLLGVLDGETYSDGKITGIIGETGSVNMVYDDFAASKKLTVGSYISTIVQIDTTYQSSYDNLVYLGSVTTNGTTITSVSAVTSRGITP